MKKWDEIISEKPSEEHKQSVFAAVESYFSAPLFSFSWREMLMASPVLGALILFFGVQRIKKPEDTNDYKGFAELPDEMINDFKLLEDFEIIENLDLLMTESEEWDV